MNLDNSCELQQTYLVSLVVSIANYKLHVAGRSTHVARHAHAHTHRYRLRIS
jgi:hypothetical protein